MNPALNNVILEGRDAQNVSYVLNDQNLFFLTGYKVLQSREDNGFVRCAKVMYNGKIKLVYLISNYKSVASLLPSLSPGSFAVILANTIRIILDVKNNGFLICENLEISLDKIYVDCSNLFVYLVYLPINTEVSPRSSAQFENEFKFSIVNAIRANPNLSDPLLFSVCNECANGTSTLESIFHYFQNAPGSNIPEAKGPGVVLNGLVFASVNTPVKITFTINKPEFIIGKSETADGVLAFNKAISRQHCKFVYLNGNYFLMDMGSANGTFVNNKKVDRNQTVPIKVNDRVRLANSEFIIKQK